MNRRVAMVLRLLLAVWPVADCVAQRGYVSLPADVTFTDPKSNKPVTLSGELKFTEWPVLADGKKSGIGLSALVPSKLDPRWFRRRDARHFEVSAFRGKNLVEFDFDRIPLELGAADMLAFAMEEGRTELFDEDILEPGQPAAAASAPVVLLVGQKTDLTFIEVARIQSIEFKPPPGWSGELTGRFVSYSNRVKGSNGAVQVAAATWFGGAGDEGFVGGAFLADGSIIALATLTAPVWAAEAPVTVIGRDPDRPAEPASAAAPVIARYSADLKRLVGITRFGWGSGVALTLRTSPQGAHYISGRAGENFSDVIAAAGRSHIVEAAGAAAAPDSFLARLAPDATRLEWVVVFRGRNIDYGFRRDGEVLVESGRSYWILTGDGAVRDGPERTPLTTSRRCPLAVSPVDNAFYHGGDYHSGTGFEPYRNPYLFRFDETGQVRWTAWNWTGPMVGTYFRQVSDSAVRLVRFARNGDLLVVGWSDGGNTVLSNEPYDLERHHRKYGFFHDMSAANVGSFAHLLRMDPDTMEVRAATYWMAYHPLTNKPNSGSVRDIIELQDGRWLLAGGTAWAMIETPDAWVTPWVAAHAADPAAARPQAGPAIAVFDSALKELLFCSLTPGLSQQHLAARGRFVLLAGRGKPIDSLYGSQFNAILKDAVQPEFGGGATDGYLMLIDTAAAPPNP
jgi:hypothetical protein